MYKALSTYLESKGHITHLPSHNNHNENIIITSFYDEDKRALALFSYGGLIITIYILIKSFPRK